MPHTDIESAKARVRNIHKPTDFASRMLRPIRGTNDRIGRRLHLQRQHRQEQLPSRQIPQEIHETCWSL